MPIRKLGRSGSGEACGAESMVSGGIPDPLADTHKSSQSQAGAPPEVPIIYKAKADHHADAEPAPAPAPKADDPAGDSANWQPGVQRLETARNEILTALRQAKEELAQEMEANLKQLKAVLQETQRIAKEMEAVLKEAKGEERVPDQKRHKADDQPPWDPPGYGKKTKGAKSQNKADDADDQQDQNDQDGPPAWEPPQPDDSQHAQSH